MGLTAACNSTLITTSTRDMARQVTVALFASSSTSTVTSATTLADVALVVLLGGQISRVGFRGGVVGRAGLSVIGRDAESQAGSCRAGGTLIRAGQRWFWIVTRLLRTFSVHFWVLLVDALPLSPLRCSGPCSHRKYIRIRCTLTGSCAGGDAQCQNLGTWRHPRLKQRPDLRTGGFALRCAAWEMQRAVTHLPSFDHPPVIEVAVGVHFLQLPGLNTVALVRLADMWRERFLKVQEQPPLPPVAPGGSRLFTFEVENSPPPHRFWLLTKSESLLVQIQHDRLLLNWRKVKDDDPYPRYGQLRQEFSQLWSEFTAIVLGGQFGAFQPTLAEVTFSTEFRLTPLQRCRASSPR